MDKNTLKSTRNRKENGYLQYKEGDENHTATAVKLQRDWNNQLWIPFLVWIWYSFIRYQLCFDPMFLQNHSGHAPGRTLIPSESFFIADHDGDSRSVRKYLR